MAEGKRWRQRVVRGGVRRSAVRPVVRLPAAGDGPGAGAGRPTRSRLAPAAGPAPLTGGGAPHERLPGRPGGAAAADRTADRDGPPARPPTAVTGAYRCTWGAEGEGAAHRARGPVARPPGAANVARAGRDGRDPRAPSVRGVFRSALT
ncbi:Exonuclease SbcC [Streptomyces sp. KY75]|nr:Exonuclease SbcC [Streptomyces sp. KY75]